MHARPTLWQPRLLLLLAMPLLMSVMAVGKMMLVWVAHRALTPQLP